MKQYVNGNYVEMTAEEVAALEHGSGALDSDTMDARVDALEDFVDAMAQAYTKGVNKA